jgi:predicted esterase|tara:strand:- start:118437 stop:119087 length:651 start_codon:yes stop_codon:yes gene_type:complete
LEKRFFTTPRTARFYLLGNTLNPTKIWVAIHGYGQQGKYFSKKVEALLDEETLVVIPEALNRYYLKGFNGRVGATWMTSDDRQADIQDNTNYLEELITSIHTQYPSINELNVFAFSQGIATACRWYAESRFSAKKLVFWAGSLANDLNFNQYKNKFNSSEIAYVFGNSDEFFEASKILMNESLFLNANIDYQLVTFEGKHVIDSKLLKELAHDKRK